jgi:hypothetical protein
VTIEYDAAGKETGLRYWHREEKPATHPDGYHAELSSYAGGKETRREFRDAGGNLTPTKLGYSAWDATYDARGNQTRKRYFDHNGGPGRPPSGASAESTTYDGNRPLVLTLLGYDGSRGYAVVVREFVGGDRNVFVESYRDAAGRVVPQADGYFAARIVLRNGLSAETFYFDPYGSPMPHKAGYYGIAWEHDASRREIKVSYYDADRRPMRHPSSGQHVLLTEYGPGPNERTHTFQDENGRPAAHKYGYFRRWQRLDAAGRVIDEKFLTPDGERLVPGRNGVGRSVDVFDSRGRLAEQTFYYVTPKGEPRGGPTDAAVEVVTYAPDGRVLRRLYQGYDGTAGYFGQRVEYDDRGRWVFREYHDRGGKRAIPTGPGWGYAAVRRSYPGDAVDARFLDTHLNPVRASGGGGGARTLTRYDEFNNATAVEYFDERDSSLYGGWLPFRFQGTYRGKQLPIRTEAWAYIAERGEVVRAVTTHDKDGKPVDRQFYNHGPDPLPVAVVVNQVVPNSRAAAARIKPGDVITHYGGRPVTSVVALQAATAASREPVEVRVRRGDQALTLKAEGGQLGVAPLDRLGP